MAYLEGSCLSVTPPGGTLNTVEFAGLGGTKWGVPGGIDYGNTVSIKFLEFTGMPIQNIIGGWVNMIRNHVTGTYTQITDNSNMKAWYAGTLLYFTTDPSLYNINYYAMYDGVYPTKDPQDLYGSDIETIGKLEVEIEFHVDHIWREDFVYDAAVTQKTIQRSNVNFIQTRSPMSPGAV